jgi:hypothetical protein
MMGAAWATFAAYAATAAALYLAGRKVYPIPYENGRVAALLLAFAAAGAAAWRLSGAGVGARLAVLLLAPILLWAAGFLTDEERAGLGRLFRA